MKKSSLSIQVLIASLFSIQASATEISTNAALMQAMDKVTGRVNKITVPVKSEISYGDFSLILRECKKRPAEETPENFAFIDVSDKSFGTDEYNIFRGWIVSSTPGINAIEHPIYDVWLLECIDTDVDSKKLISEEELSRRDNLPTRETMQKESNYKEDKNDIVKENESENAPKEIHIKEFIQEDKDIEKNIKEVPAFISEKPSEYISDIDEGEEPENLLLFTKIQEVEQEKAASETEDKPNDDLSQAIDAEINSLKTKD